METGNSFVGILLFIVLGLFSTEAKAQDSRIVCDETCKIESGTIDAKDKTADGVSNNTIR